MANIKHGTIPVYLPGKTLIGTARVDVSNGTAVITIQSDSSLMDLMGENLIGLSVVYMSAERIEENTTEGEETDGTTR